MVRQAQKEGQAKAASPEVARVASSIKKSDAKDFASTKHKGLPEKKKMNEEGYDHYRDNILMKGGDHRSKETKNRSYTPSKPVKGKTAAQKAAKGKSALEIVKDKIRKEYGKGAIMGEENLEEKKKGLWDNIHAKRKRGEKPAKKGDKDYPETLNVEDVNCDDRKKMVADHGALHKKKSDETGGLPRPVAAKNRVATKQGIDEAKVDKGRSDYGKASIRNYRRMGPGHGEPGMFDPEGKRGKTIEKRREEHKARRGVKGAKVPAYKVDEGSSYGLYKGSGKAGGAMKAYLDKKAEMLKKKRNKQSDAAKNNPHFDSTQPSPSGRNKYEQVSFQQFQEKCWPGYEKKGMKTMFGKRYPNCVKKKK